MGTEIRKIVHLSDIHHDPILADFVQTEQAQTADLVVFTGDASGRPTGAELKLKQQEEKIKEAARVKLQKLLNKMPQKRKKDLGIWSVYDYIEYLEGLNSPMEELQTFLAAEKTLEGFDDRQLEEIAAEFDKLPGRKFFVHGNWDSDKFLEVFDSWELHKKKITLDGLLYYGYGGSGSCLNPFTHSSPTYDEDVMHKQLLKIQPDVILTHAPPRKMTDLGNTSNQLLGSAMLRSYVFEAAANGKAPKLVMSGHSHRPLVEELVTGTVISNPGNLGDADGEPHGNFNVIYMKKGEVDHVEQYIMKGKIAVPFDEKEQAKWKQRINNRGSKVAFWKGSKNDFKGSDFSDTELEIYTAYP